MKKRGMAWAEFGAVMAIVFVLGLITYSLVSHPRRDWQGRASCANNLRQLGLSLKMYSNESRAGLYPPVGYYRQPVVDCDDPAYPETGDISQVYTGFFDIPAMYPEYLPDLNVTACPDQEGHRDWEATWVDHFYDEYDKVCLQPNRGVETLLQSYVYFPYAICTYEQRFSVATEVSNLSGVGHIDAFLNSNGVSSELPVKLALMYDIIYDHKAANADALSEILREDIDMTTIYEEKELDPLLERDVFKPRLGEAYAYGNAAYRLFRMREGVDRFFITEIGWPGGSETITSHIPLVATRVTSDKRGFRHHGPKTGLGGNVLFLDGHVENLDYAPENFPISPGMALLHESIDASPVFQKRF